MKKIVAIVIIISLLFLIKDLIISINKSIASDNAVVNLNNQLQKNKHENEYLKEKLSYVKSDEFVEKQARDKLGMVKPGEKIVVGPGPDALINEKKNTTKEDIPNRIKWWKLFFD